MSYGTRAKYFDVNPGLYRRTHWFNRSDYIKVFSQFILKLFMSGTLCQNFSNELIRSIEFKFQQMMKTGCRTTFSTRAQVCIQYGLKMNLTPIWLRHFKHFSYVSYSKLSHSFRIFLRKKSMKINGIKSLSLSFERLFGSISTDHWRSNCESTELHRKYASIFLISTSFLCVCYIHVCYLIP